jgi:chemotaxis protein histidine kinase CheA
MINEKIQQLELEIEKYQQLLEQDLSEEELEKALANLDDLTTRLQDELMSLIDTEFKTNEDSTEEV